MKHNWRRVDGSTTDFDLGLHRLVVAADGGGSRDYTRIASFHSVGAVFPDSKSPSSPKQSMITLTA